MPEATTLLNAALCLPLASRPAMSASDREEAGDKGCWGPEAGSTRRQLYVPRTYIPALIALIGAYLGAIFALDRIACKDTTECRNYSKLENGFSRDSVMETINTWTPQGRAAMALSAGLHIFSSFLFAQLFIVGALVLRERFAAMGKPRLERTMSLVPYTSRVFNAFYCTVHCLNASMVVGGNPSKATPVVEGVLLIISLVLLVANALSIIAGSVYVVVWRCCCSGASVPPRLPASQESEPRHRSSAHVTAVVVVP